MSDHAIFEEPVSNYNGGLDLTLRIAARDGHVVVGLSRAVGDERACLLELPVAEVVLSALQEAIAHAKQGKG